MSVFDPAPRIKPSRLPPRNPPRAIPSLIAEEGVVGAWLFNYTEGGNILYDHSGEDDHGTLNGPTWQSGRCGWFLRFREAESDYVHLPLNNPLGNLDHYTILGWIYLESTTGSNQQLFTQSNTGDDTPFVALGYDDGNVAVHFWHFDDAGNSADPYGGTVNTGGWYLFGGKRDVDDFYVYLDGASVGSETASIGDTTLDTEDMGRLTRTSPTNYLDGRIALAWIFTKTLTDSKISRIYERTRGIFRK